MFVAEKVILHAHTRNLILIAQCRYLQRVNNSKIAESRLKDALIQAKE